MTITEKFFVECVKCGIKDQKVSYVQDNIDLNRFYSLCRTHSMGVIVFSALQNVMDQFSPEFVKRLKKSVYRHIMLDTQSEYDNNTFLSELDKRGLKHMPLKGYYLKKLYPNTAMRYTSDCDVLIDVSQIKQIRELVDELGLKTKRHDEHHDIVYYPITKTVFELHKMLFVGPLNDYFGTGFERASLKNGTNSFYEMSAEDFYISILAHSAYHFAEGAGVGIRHICDVYLYKKANELDYKYLDTELNKCGLLKFKNQFEKIADYFFDGVDADDETRILAGHIINSSLFENKENKAASDIAANTDENRSSGSKIKTMFKSIFPSKSHMQFTYPIIKKAGVLLPLFYPVRWFNVLFTRPENIAKLKEYNSVDKKSVSDMKKIRDMLGINNL